MKILFEGKLYVKGVLSTIEIKWHPENKYLLRVFINDEYLFSLDDVQMDQVNSRFKDAVQEQENKEWEEEHASELQD